jgi:hypothetical protein
VTSFDEPATGLSRVVVERVPGGGEAPRRCRRLARALFEATPGLAEIAVLAASELATEAILDGAASLVVRVEAYGSGGRIAVNGSPTASCAEAVARGPRTGRILLGALADEMGIECRSGPGWLRFAGRGGPATGA